MMWAKMHSSLTSVTEHAPTSGPNFLGQVKTFWCVLQKISSSLRLMGQFASAVLRGEFLCGLRLGFLASSTIYSTFTKAFPEMGRCLRNQFNLDMWIFFYAGLRLDFSVKQPWLYWNWPCRPSWPQVLVNIFEARESSLRNLNSNHSLYCYDSVPTLVFTLFLLSSLADLSTLELLMVNTCVLGDLCWKDW